MKSRRENHKYLVFEQQMEKRNTRSARKYGYIEESRRRQRRIAEHNYIMSYKNHHKCGYAYQNIVNGFCGSDKKLGKRMIEDARKNGFKL